MTCLRKGVQSGADQHTGRECRYSLPCGLQLDGFCGAVSRERAADGVADQGEREHVPDTARAPFQGFRAGARPAFETVLLEVGGVELGLFSGLGRSVLLHHDTGGAGAHSARL